MDDLKIYSINRAKSLLKNENSKDGFYCEFIDKDTLKINMFIYKRIGFLNWIAFELNNSNHKTIGSKRKYFLPKGSVNLNELREAIEYLKY